MHVPVHMCACCNHVPVRLHIYCNHVWSVPVCVIVCMLQSCTDQYMWLCACYNHVWVHMCACMLQSCTGTYVFLCMHGNIFISECAPWLMNRILAWKRWCLASYYAMLRPWNASGSERCDFIYNTILKREHASTGTGIYGSKAHRVRDLNLTCPHVWRTVACYNQGSDREGVIATTQTKTIPSWSP